MQMAEEVLYKTVFKSDEKMNSLDVRKYVQLSPLKKLVK